MNLILVLTIWSSPCVESSLVLLGLGLLLCWRAWTCVIMTLFTIFLFIMIHFFRNLDHLGRSMSIGWGSKMTFFCFMNRNFSLSHVFPWTSGDTMDMAPLIHMPEPLCLIENTNGQLLANPEALKILSAIRQPVVVVAIMGLNRTGKSYLINKLAGQNKGEWHQQSPAKSFLFTHTPNMQHSDVRRESQRPGRNIES